MKDQRGFTLVEMMLAFIITAAIAAVLGMTAQAMVSVPEQSSERTQALHALQNVVHWVGQDTSSAETAAGGESLTLTMPDDTVISYLKTGDIVYRSSGGENSAVAQSITSMNFTVVDRIVYMSITAAPPSRWDTAESRTYQVAMRPSGL